MSVVNMRQFQEEREAEVWQRYLDARAEAERSGDKEWGIAAGRAWREWLELFHTPQQKEREREFQRVVRLQRLGYLPRGRVPR